MNYYKLLAILFVIVISLSNCTKETLDGKQNQPETCSDGIQNQAENGIDCGGPCAACPTCFDGIQNQDETGIDCGGPCDPCLTCSDGIQNQGETGIDCGGPCPPCPPVIAPCMLTNNTSDFPLGMQDDVYNNPFCKIEPFYGNYQINASGSYSDITIEFKVEPLNDKIYLTTNSTNLSSLTENQVVISTVAGGTFSYLYYANSVQDVYVTIVGGLVRVEFCDLIFNSASSTAFNDLPVSANISCDL